MTSKIQIDQATIARALEAYYGDGFVANGMTERRMHKALEAALNPPEEPEIPVSEGMLKAGATLWRKGDNHGHPWWPESGSEAIYRAMEKARRKEEVPQQRFHCREGEMRPGGIMRAHRRKGDPK